MKKTILISIIYVLQLQIANAQKLSYDIVKDDPKNFKPFSLSLDPFNGGMYMGNALIGAKVKADLILFKRIEARFEYNYFYLDMLASKKKVSTNSSGMELGGSFFLFNRTKNKTLEVTLSTSESGNKRYRTYLKVPAHKFVMWGIRGGVLVEKNNFQATAADKFVVINVANNLDTMKSFGSAKNAEFETQLISTILYAGISRKGITNLLLDVDGYNKKKKNAVMNDVFVDVMMAPILSIANIQQVNRELEVIPADGVKQTIGWRCGWVFRNPEKVGFSAKIEFGSKPQIKTGDSFGAYYGFVSFGLNIPMTIKALQNIGNKKTTTPTSN